MKKILIVSTVSRQFYLFEESNIEVLHSLGYEVHAAANYYDSNERLDALDIIRHHVDIQRSPLSSRNIKAYRQLKQLMISEKFDAVHCHSPVGGVLARMAAKSIGIPSVIYTAHGFHFYKGASLISWIIYYPIEKYMAKITDIMITINKEDYARAQKSFEVARVEYIPGIGLDTRKYGGVTTDREKKRAELSIPTDAEILLSVGELNSNKNHECIIKAVAKLNDPRIYYVICGEGHLKENLKGLATSLGIERQVVILGLRNDVSEIYHASDIFILPSFREGLPVSLMEAMAAGLSVVCSKIRGNTDLISDEEGGYLLTPQNVDGFAESILTLINNVDLRMAMGRRNIEEVKRYDKVVVKEEMRKLYQTLIYDEEL